MDWSIPKKRLSGDPMYFFSRSKVSRAPTDSRWGALARPKLFSPPSRFTPEIEEKYLAYHGEHYVGYRRNAIIFSFLSWIVFIGWDVFYSYTDENYREAAFTVFILRAFGIAVFAHFRFKSLERSFENERHATRQIIIHAGVLYGLMLAMFTSVPIPYAFIHFYSGLCLTLVFVYGLSRILSRPAVLMSVSCGASTVGLMVVRNAILGDGSILSLTGNYIWMASCYLCIIILCGTAIVTELEKTSRSVFMRGFELAESKAEEQVKNFRLAALNQDLLNAQAELESKTDALIKSMDERRRLAEEGNKEKSYFISCAIHDVRQPATAMLSLIRPIETALSAGELDKASVLLSKMARAGAIMNNSFSNVLDLSRIESGLTAPEYENFKVNEVMASAIEATRLAAESNGVWIKLIPSRHDMPLIRSDYSFLLRVLCNLIGNGIKYCDRYKSPKVVIAATRLEHAFRIDVIDNGIGIEERFLGDIFSPFFQIRTHQGDLTKGLGLGLSLVQGMISRLKDHRIKVRSVEHRGSRFSVHIPLADRAWPARIVEPKDPLQTAEQPRLYALLMEQNDMTRESMIECLQCYDVHVESSSSLQGLQALMRDVETPPDIVLLDTSLLHADSDLDLIREKASFFGADIPILFVEGPSRPAWIDHTRHTLCKPFLSQELLEQINKARRALVRVQASGQ